jgi:hypothetical protein
MTATTARDVVPERTGRASSPGGRRGGWCAAVVLAALLAAGAVAAARSTSTSRTAAEHRLAERERALARSQRDLAALGTRVIALEAAVRDREQERLAAAGATAGAQEGLSTAQRELAGAQVSQATQSARLLATRTCLDGARRALDAITSADTARAVVQLQAVTTACTQALAAGDPDAPVYGFDFADPFVLRAGDALYAFATNATGGAVQVLVGRDARTWAPAGTALAQLPAWARPGTTWSPAVLPRDGGYVLYYATREIATNRQCISTAFAANPAGPYTDTSAGPLECGAQGAIDPSPFVASDGTPYLLWKQEPNRIVGQQLRADGRALVGPRRTLLAPSRGWEGGNVEAPSMMVTGGRYWLFYSGNRWDGRGYAQGVAACAGPLGGCRADAAPFVASHGAVAGPGGGEVFVDLAGHWQLAYHAYREPAVGYPNSRFLHVAPLVLDGTGHPVIG